jgi:hypothetical protein
VDTGDLGGSDVLSVEIVPVPSVRRPNLMRTTMTHRIYRVTKIGIKRISSFLVASLSIFAISSADKPWSDSLYESRWSFVSFSRLVRDMLLLLFIVGRD